MIETDRMRPAGIRAPAAMLAALWAISLCGCGGTDGKSLFDLATAAELDPGKQACRIDVYLFRGLLDQPSSGLNDLAAALRAEGLNATAHPYTAWESLLAEIERTLVENEPPRIVLMGHSYGADAAVRLAQRLADRGFSVPLLYLLDATAPPPVPANVDRCVQVYNPNDLAQAAPGVFPGNPIFAEAGNTHTVVVNLRARVEDLGPDAAEFDPAAGLLNHLTMDSNLAVQRLAIVEAIQVCDALNQP